MLFIDSLSYGPHPPGQGPGQVINRNIAAQRVKGVKDAFG